MQPGQIENLKWKEKKQQQKKNREVISSCCSQYPNYNTQQVINLLLVSWGGAPGFWKEEAASWSMGAEPGWLSEDETRRAGREGRVGEGEKEGV